MLVLIYVHNHLFTGHSVLNEHYPKSVVFLRKTHENSLLSKRQSYERPQIRKKCARENQAKFLRHRLYFEGLVLKCKLSINGIQVPSVSRHVKYYNLMW